MLRIHGIPRSRAFRCIWAAEEAGQAYEVVPVDHRTDVQAPEFRAINPNGKIPVLVDGALILFESLAINLHIAGKAGAPLLPSGDDHARTLQWALWAVTEAEPQATLWSYNTVSRPPAERDPALAAAGAEGLRTRLAVLEAQLHGRDFLLGGGFTIADCNLAGVLYSAWFNKFPMGDFPRVAGWLTRCLERPAALRARALREA